MAKNPASLSSTSLPSLEVREAHREWIGGRIATLLSHYWREDDSIELVKAIAKDWADVLEDLPQNAIQKACIQYQREESRRKPTPGAIYALAQDHVRRTFLVTPRPIEQPRQEPRCDPEVAQAICEKAGFTPKRFGDVT